MNRTSDEMQLKGVRIFDTEPAKTCDTTATINIADEDNALKRPLENENIPLTTLRIMAACHSLAAANISRSSKGDTKKKNQMQVIGDPLEQTVLRESGYRLTGNSIVDPIEAIEVDVSSRHSTTTTTDDRRRRINILHRFAFSSKLKRMTVLCTEGDANVMGSAIWAVSKGAPETIKDLLSISSIPINYDDVAYHHMSRGRRVLAMAYRDAGTIRNLQSLKDGGREKVEYNLIFAGFLVLDCPLKSDSKSVVSDLRKSGLDVVMITGDAILTAAEVARQVGILRKPTAGKRTVYEIRKKENDTAISANNDPLNCLEYIPLGRTGSTQSQNQELLIHPLRNDNIAYLRRIVINHEVAFCISGDTLVTLALTALSMEHGQTTKQALVDEKILLLSTPAQKALQKLVPIISVFARHAPHQKEAVVAAFNSAGYCTLMCGDGTNDVGALKRAHVGISIISAPNVEKKQRNANANIAKVKTDDRVATMKKSGKTTKKSTTSQKVLTIEESLRQLRQAQEELDQVELGDASVAAPFTSRAVSIKCCKDVIQQGRCTLVTMLQIYKILGINCLVNAFVLSELFLHGVKQGDRQLTILGMAVASLFYFVTRAEPLPTLSTIQPPASVLCSEALLSIVGQCFIHIMMTALITECALSYIDPFDPSLVPDGPFNPNVLNTCTFLITCVAAST
jgi:cation-transporting ATPase 13A1